MQALKPLRPAIDPRDITSLGIMLVGIAVNAGCGGGYRERVIPAVEFTPLERARQMLERYANGQPVGSDFMGFELLRKELARTSPERSDGLGAAFTAIERAMHRPAEVKAIAQKALANLDKPAVSHGQPTPTPSP